MEARDVEEVSAVPERDNPYYSPEYHAYVEEVNRDKPKQTVAEMIATAPRLFESDEEHEEFLAWLYESRRTGRA
jgi:hypothetical protein